MDTALTEWVAMGMLDAEEKDIDMQIFGF